MRASEPDGIDWAEIHALKNFVVTKQKTRRGRVFHLTSAVQIRNRVAAIASRENYFTSLAIPCDNRDTFRLALFL